MLNYDIIFLIGDLMNIDKLINILKKGELAIIPTDTTYGIVCDATNDDAVRKVFLTKKRDFNKPLIILASDIEMVIKYTKKISSLEEDIIKEFWPGPLTILLLKNSLVSDLVTASSPFVGIRIPHNIHLQNVIKRLNRPIVATSANLSGEDVITDVSNIDQELVKNVSYICYGNKISSIPSTLIKVNENKIEFLREGIIAPKIKEKFKNNI